MEISLNIVLPSILSRSSIEALSARNMSTLSLLVVPMKRTYKVDIVNPLKNIINGLNNEIHHNAVNHSEAIIQFSKLRNLATATPAKGADTLKVLYECVN